MILRGHNNGSINNSNKYKNNNKYIKITSQLKSSETC